MGGGGSDVGAGGRLVLGSGAGGGFGGRSAALLLPVRPCDRTAFPTPTWTCIAKLGGGKCGGGGCVASVAVAAGCVCADWNPVTRHLLSLCRYTHGFPLKRALAHLVGSLSKLAHRKTTFVTSISPVSALEVDTAPEATTAPCTATAAAGLGGGAALTNIEKIVNMSRLVCKLRSSCQQTPLGEELGSPMCRRTRHTQTHDGIRIPSLGYPNV